MRHTTTLSRICRNGRRSCPLRRSDAPADQPGRNPSRRASPRSSARRSTPPFQPSISPTRCVFTSASCLRHPSEFCVVLANWNASKRNVSRHRRLFSSRSTGSPRSPFGSLSTSAGTSPWGCVGRQAAKAQCARFALRRHSASLRRRECDPAETETVPSTVVRLCRC